MATRRINPFWLLLGGLGVVLLAAGTAIAAPFLGGAIKRVVGWRGLIRQIAVEEGVDPVLIAAHMAAESGGDPAAVRSEPALRDRSIGLMQVLCQTARRFVTAIRCDDLFDPELNIRAGARVIRDNLQRYGGNIPNAVAAYNAGVARKDAQGYFVNSRGDRAVQTYVNRVLAFRQQLQGQV